MALVVSATSIAFGDDLTLTSFSAYAGQTNILLQASGNIILSGTDGSLTLPDLPAGTAGLLSVEAGNDIIVQTNLSAGLGWSLYFQAGNNLDSTGGSISAKGNITIQTGGMLPTNWSDTPVPGGTITIGGDGQGGIGILPGPAVPVGPPAQLILLDSQFNGANVTAVAGTNVLFLDIADGTASCRFQWFKNGRKLHGETNDVLSLTNIRLTDAGNYFIVASNHGSNVRCNVNLHVLQPPRGTGHRPF